MRTLLLVLSLLVSPTVADAQGINLAWDDCYAGGGAVDKTNSCTGSGLQVDALMATVWTEQTDFTSIVGVEGVIDMSFEDAVMPDYWQMGAGGCQSPGLSLDMHVGSVNPPFSCPEPWSQVGGQAGGALFEPYYSCNNRARIRWVIAVLEGVTLGAGQEWYVGKLNLVRNDANGCTGCTVPACIILNHVILYRPAGTPGGDFFITNPAIQADVTWQAGPLGCPPFPPSCPTPVQNRTWGQMKSLYR